MADLLTAQELGIKLYQTIGASDTPRTMDYFHASQMAQCVRAHYYSRLGIPAINKPTGAKILRWDTGHKVEAAIRPHLLKVFPNLVSNVRFTNEKMQLSGEVDNYDPDSKSIIEIKSVHPYAIGKLKKGSGPYLAHEYQEHAYVELMRDFDTQVGEKMGDIIRYTADVWPVENIYYLYIGLDGLLIPYRTEVKPEILEKVQNRLRMLNQAWEQQTPPPCICSDSHALWDSSMRWCNYQTDNDCCNLNLLKKENEDE